MNPLNDIISLLKPRAIVSKPITGRGKWGVRYEAYGHPSYAIVLAGTGYLSLEGGPSVPLNCGDFVLLPATPAFRFSSHRGMPCVDAEPSESGVHYGEKGHPPDFSMLGGAFKIDLVNTPLMLTLLPGIIHIPAEGSRTGRLEKIVQLVREESQSDRPGKDMILARLMEILLVESLRWLTIEENAAAGGLLAGLRHQGLAQALRAIHEDVSYRWTVAELGKRAGMSRSVFASQFRKALGCAPIEYLSQWRLALAQEALIRGNKSLDRLAYDIGYESASAFSTAFRRRVGCAPGAFAKKHKVAQHESK